MQELAIVLSGLIANALTAAIKPGEDYKLDLTQEELDARKTLVRGINLVLGIVMTVVGAWVVGEPIDVTNLESSVSAVVTMFVTFTFSQGAYFLLKK